MATTSMSLGDHWESFIRNQVGSGRYGSASEVVRDALRTLEAQQSRLEALRAHLGVGADQAHRGEFVTDYSADRVIADLDSEG